MTSCQSTIFRKMMMGICGAVWMGFVFTHMAANLLILYSAEAYNKYSHALVSNKPLLYSAEAILLIALIGHVYLGISITIANRRANKKVKLFPNKYAMAPAANKKPRFGSKTMGLQGSVILAFIILHLITFKYGPAEAEGYTVVYDGIMMRDMHRLVVEVFQSPGYVFWYSICLVLLGIHLWHGFWSVFQTYGINHPRYTPILKKAGYLYAFVVAAGFLVQPIYVYLLM